jgi:hypothetical protein
MTDKATAPAKEVDDLLGGTSTPSKSKSAAKPAAKTSAKPAAKTAAPAAKPVKVAAVKAEKAVREPVTFAEGEREALAKRVKQTVKKPWNSKELAAKLEIPTRKLRQVLYSMDRAGTIKLELAASRALGMTVSPATAAAVAA